MACEDERPSNILSFGKMEDVLYDYHLAQGMLEQVPADDREKMAQAYIDAVFEKYNITEAEFDSSLIWYNRHTEDLTEIYANIQERLTEENQEIALMTGNNELVALSSQAGDTTNIWNASQLIVLRSKPGVNFETFSLTADSTYRRKDRFVLVCNPVVIRENENDYDSYVNIGFTIRYKDGTTTGSTMRCNNSRLAQINLNSNEDKDIESLNGFFYYKAKQDYRNLALITGIGIARIHDKTQPIIAPIDTLTLDTTKIDTTPKQTATPHLTPEEMKQNTEDRIEIKSAPDVRTPNSFGPRRRPIRPARKQ